MVNEISNGLSNGKRSEAAESDVGVRVEVGMCYDLFIFLI